MKINIPSSIRGLEPLLAEFFDGMVYKLHVNSHKDALATSDVPKLLDGMIEEMQEFKDQLAEDRTDVNALAESHDAANFWFLIYAAMRKEGVATQRERFLSEYFDILPEAGRVYCVKSRSGSNYGPGDEITGSLNHKGEAVIRVQSSEGFSMTVTRAVLIWWAATGQWVSGLAHRNGDNSDDRYDNLCHTNVGPDKDSPYPFVSQYKPANRENVANYGKWVYQRRHLGRLIRCGYYDSAHDAATMGIVAWKAKVSETRERNNVSS